MGIPILEIGDGERLSQDFPFMEGMISQRPLLRTFERRCYTDIPPRLEKKKYRNTSQQVCPIHSGLMSENIYQKRWTPVAIQ